jgi:hypothetical protein
MAQTSEKQKFKMRFYISLVVWLCALPAAFIVQLILRFILSVIGLGDSEALTTIINIASVLAGFYGILGWIPTAILFFMWQSKK